MSKEDFFQRANLDYLEDMYARFQKDPGSVNDELRHFFTGFDLARTQIEIQRDTGAIHREVLPAVLGADSSSMDYSSIPVDDQSKVVELIEGYRRMGHQNADLSPLGSRERSAKLDLFTYGLREDQRHQSYYTGSLFGPEKAPLGEIIDFLEETYCGRVGVELTSIEDVEELRWLQRKVESSRNKTEFSRQEKLAIYEGLYRAEGFEKFLHTRFVGQKRFSLEGLDSLVPLLNGMVEQAGVEGIEEIFLGMAHRGRLNVLTNIFKKPYQAVFAEFDGENLGVDGDGDVKYHMGYANEIPTGSGRNVYIALNPNPSHLELVNPVILGKCYSRQSTMGDQERKKVMPVLLHGDAAFAGQGINMEVLQLSRLEGYGVGGTLHVILDNQIGFTAEAHETRSTRYPTDLFKMAGCPVFHVNGDDPEAAVHAIRLAVEYRQKFGRDVAVDLIGYRRHGHNEGDEPMFTQPSMYSFIRKHATACKQYREQLVQSGFQDQELKDIETKVDQELEEGFDKARAHEPIKLRNEPRFGWQDIVKKDGEVHNTGVKLEILDQLVEKLSSIPEDLKANRKVRKFHEGRKESWQKDQVDWNFAESLAFGSTLLEGHPVRLSGQDVQRGTFTQRNVVLQSEDGGEYIPLNQLGEDQAQLTVYNSALSELAVLGFDYGFSLSNPNALVAWEAQFGDFANGAQSMVDNFISSAESKWNRHSGLVFLLPHGYEGAGPEHSSARLERWLQLCAEENLRVCNCTTPANYFHVLRRQVVHKDRKPLVLMTPKSLLRHRRAVSAREEFADSRHFEPILVGRPDGTRQKAESVTRVLAMSGKIYYDILEKLEESGAEGIELVRLEQIYPFPEQELSELIQGLPNLKEFVWVQEEKKNMGAWFFVEPRLRELLEARSLVPQYIGRKPGASPATGFAKVHGREQAEIVQRALEGMEQK